MAQKMMSYTEGCSILATDQDVRSHPGNDVDWSSIYSVNCECNCVKAGTAFECHDGMLRPIGAASLAETAAVGATTLVLDDINGFAAGKMLKLPNDFGQIEVAGTFVAGEMVTATINGVAYSATVEEGSESVEAVTLALAMAADKHPYADAVADGSTVLLFSQKPSGANITYAVSTDSAAGTVVAAGTTLAPVMLGTVVSVDAAASSVVVDTPVAMQLNAGLNLITEFCPDLVRGLLECDLCSYDGCWPTGIATIYSGEIYCSRVKAWGPDLKAALPNIVCVECC